MRNGRFNQRVLAVLAGAVAALVVWGVSLAAGVDVRVPETGQAGRTQELGPGLVLVTSLLAGLAGWALLAVLERFARSARRLWVFTAVAVLILSFAGPLTAAGITAGNRAVLMLLHVAVAVAVVPLLARTSRASRQSPRRSDVVTAQP